MIVVLLLCLAGGALIIAALKQLQQERSIRQRTDEFYRRLLDP